MRNDTENDLKDSFSLSYKFSFLEVISLAKLLRKNQERLPSELSSFEREIENAVYTNLSLEEMKDFYEK